MSLFSTPTPAYKNQAAKPDVEPVRGFWDWLRSLTSTPTPVYKTVAAHSTRHAQTASQAAGAINDNRREDAG